MQGVRPQEKENKTMNLMKHIRICLGLILLCTGCGSTYSDDKYVDKFSLLNGNDFVLKIGKIMIGRSNVQFLTDVIFKKEITKSQMMVHNIV